MNATEEAGAVTCPGCGKVFVCGVTAGLPTCWCMEKPVALPVSGDEARCYCSQCLARLSASESVREA